MSAKEEALKALATLEAEWPKHEHDPAWWVGYLQAVLENIARMEDGK